jgi:hypothetical protein
VGQRADGGGGIGGEFFKRGSALLDRPTRINFENFGSHRRSLVTALIEGHLGPARENKCTHGLPKGSVLEGLPKFRSVFDGGLARRQKLELEESVTDVVLFACVVGVVMLGLGVDVGAVIVWLRRRWL